MPLSIKFIVKCLNIMNAIINLNHFCEIHGPTTIFSTQTLREIKPKDINFKEAKVNETRNCCGSIGGKVLFITEDKNSSITFVSSERNILGKDNQNLLITLKSLSCEVRPNMISHDLPSLNILLLDNWHWSGLFRWFKTQLVLLFI